MDHDRPDVGLLSQGLAGGHTLRVQTREWPGANRMAEGCSDKGVVS